MRAFLARRHPAQLVVLAFAAAILLGSLLLYLPVARAGAGHAPYLAAVFTSTSAVCVTGLIVVDTPTYWSHFGQIVIMGLIQIGGFGIMTLTSLLLLVVARRLGLRTRLLAQAERATPLSDVKRIVLGVAILSLAFELVAATALTARFAAAYDYSLGRAVWHGAFHAVSSFNNAGFALYTSSLVDFAGDLPINLAITGAIVAGGLGFPVWLELASRRRPRRWSVHTKLTLSVTLGLLMLGMAAVLGFEWGHAETLGGMSTGGKLLAGFFASVTPRTAGFNTIDYAQVEPETLLGTTMLMFVGGGSAGTAGGIKVTTFAVLFLLVLAESRGDRHVEVFRRRIPAHSQRQAFVVAFLAINAVVIATVALLALSPHGHADTLFEAVSAFGTVGLSTGLTAQLGTAGQAILIALMFLGRTGPQVVAAALVLRERERRYTFPEDRPMVG